MPDIRRDRAFLGAVLSVCALLVFLLAAALASWQDRPQRGSAESREVRLEGWLRALPHPSITPLPAPLTNNFESSTEYLLVGPAKRGLATELAELDGHRVSVRGRLVFRDRMTLVVTSREEIDDLGLEPPPHPLPATSSLGERRLVGELVDLKCFVGAMKPGHGRVHRACASLCIAGELPAALATRVDGEPRLVLLEADASLLPRLAVLAGEQVTADGELLRRGRFRWLRLFRIEPTAAPPRPGAVQQSPQAPSLPR